MDDKNVVFMTGLPRSGSTVLANILQQHPEIFTTASDPISEVVLSVMEQRNNSGWFDHLDPSVADTGLHQFVYKGTMSWLDSLTSKPNIISCGRNWGLVSHLYPNTKFIVHVRDLVDVAESHAYRQFSNNISNDLLYHHPGLGYELPVPFTSIPNMNIVDSIFNQTPYIATALNIIVPHMIDLSEKDNDRVLFVRYENLLSNPREVLDGIERFVGVDAHNYDLENIQQQQMLEHDGCHKGLVSHVTKPVLQHVEKPQVLPDYVHMQIRSQYKWFYDMLYPS